MAVDVRSHTGLGVPGPLLDSRDRDAHVHQERECRMPEVMEAHVRQSGLLEQLLELVPDAMPFEGGSDRGGEDQVIFLPAAARLFPLAILAFVVLCQPIQHALSQFDLPPARLGLWRDKEQSLVLDALELALDVQDAFAPVQVRPLQTEKLTLSHAGGERQVE